MGSFAFTIRTATPSTPVLGAPEFRRDFLTGLAHTRLSDQAIRGWLLAAERTVENLLGIKISRQLVTEDLDQWIDETSFFYLRTIYPVVDAVELKGGVTEQAKSQSYPKAWLQVKRTNQPTGYERKIFVVPQGGGQSPLNYQVAFTGLMMQNSWSQNGILPRYWRLSYLTGYDQAPEELVQLVGNLALIPALYKLANLVLPAGLTSQSISLDGLSQSLSTSDPFGKTIAGAIDQTSKQLDQLRGIYQGMVFTVL